MSYSKHEWNDGELITKELMNNMEKGIEDANNRVMTPGPQGENGQSAYELWKSKSGNEEKSEEEFLTSLKGEKGDTGAQGATGAKGDTGKQGPAGAKGDAGKRGSIWTVGTALSGEASNKKFESSGLDSLLGDLYLNSTTYEVYKCTKDGNAANATWSKVGVLKGAKGDTGDTRQAMTHIANATGQTDAHTVLNSLLAELIAKGYMAGA